MPVMVRFRASEATWLVSVDNVVGIRSIDDIRPLPSPDASVLGVIDHAGGVCAVVDALGGTGGHVLLLSIGDTLVGVRTDEVHGVTDFGPDGLEPRPAGQDRPFVAATRSTDGDLAYILDVEELARPLATAITTSNGDDHG